jgi:hypothetical protein
MGVRGSEFVCRMVGDKAADYYEQGYEPSVYICKMREIF